MNKKTNNLYIFNQFKNNKNKLVPFNINNNDMGEIKYFPPVAKEWKNNICAFNFNNLKNLSLYDKHINSLITAYFNLYLKHRLDKKRLRRKRRLHLLSMNKVFTSKAEIKHNSNKILITLYAYDREKRVLLKKIKKLKKTSLVLKAIFKIFKNVNLLMLKTLKRKINKKIFKARVFVFGKKNLLKNNLLRKNIHKQFIILKKEREIKLFNNVYFLKKLQKKLFSFKRLKLRLNINKLKFEEMFLSKLNGLISQLYNKKAEFNIVKLKSIVFNTDLFAKILTLKIKRKKKSARVLRWMKFALNKAKLPKVNRIIEKSTPVKTVDFNLLENKYKDLHLQSIINENNLDEILNQIYPSIILNNNYNNVSNIIFNKIKYKNMGGIRIEVKGRLTKRYRADRSVFKLLWKGGLKNIDSSYKRLSSAIMRGSIKSNVEYSIFTSKRRIGAFAVKGWISGK